jgi:hypothetical protein
MTQYRLQKLYSNNVQLLVPSKGGQAGHDTQLEGREEYKILVGRHPKKKKVLRETGLNDKIILKRVLQKHFAKMWWTYFNSILAGQNAYWRARHPFLPY